MSKIIKKLTTAYFSRHVEFGKGMAKVFLERVIDCTIITSNSPFVHVKDALEDNHGALILNPPIELRDLDSKVRGIHTKWIVGLGGGKVCDVAKYLSLRTKGKMCLIPSILSTTSWLNPGIALRKDNMIYFAGHRSPDKIIIDPQLILKAPASLNLAGIADILCSASAVGDWCISTRGAIKHNFLKKVKSSFIEFIDNIVEKPEQLFPFTEDSIRYQYSKFLEAFSLCATSFSGRPLEGSEHYLYYFLTYLLPDRKIIHGY
ncbi:MAG: iron-containing alcohol dehydrogenase, partial [Promethearchaeota archaeon]